ncbi:MAG TPA: sigma-70 family RNA polymerase sigma factor, partial [Streptosporangiaceae bacterium]
DRPGSVALPAGQSDRGARMAELVRAARNGREEAMGQLVTELSPLLWQVARATGLSAGDAEDVVQTAWLRLLAHLQDIHTPSALTAWLVTTTRREAWRARSAERRQVPSDQDWLAAIPDPRPSPETLAVSDDQRRELWNALAQLSRRCQELLRIIAFAPRPDYDVIAAELGMPHGSIGPTRGRCLAKLRAILADTAERTSR